MKFRHINTIMQKELQGYFNSPLAYIFMAVFLVFTSWAFFRGVFLAGQAAMRGYFALLPWVFLLLIPAITMRQFSEERKMGTMEVLLTAPVTPWEAVLGKFFASFSFLLMNLIFSLIIPAILFIIGWPDWGTIAAGYLGALFLGAAYLAIGLFISSLADSQIISFILSAVFIFALFIIGDDAVLRAVPLSLVPIFKFLGLGVHFSSILRGVLDSRDVVYYALLVFLFLHLTVANIHNRRWR
ncbi:ABC transporter permease [Candidatus Peregrinibacteria bacterium]|nr:ABC transporter permease [Candidatus Peregrinibacteria bacterium]